MKAILFSALFGLTILAGCSKSEEPDPFCGFGTKPETPCINQKIEEIKAQPVTNPATQIFSYQYQDQLVYFITAPCCDFPSEVYDSNCNLICQPNGGFSGNGDGQCPDFFDQATNKQLVWEDTRQ